MRVSPVVSTPETMALWKDGVAHKCVPDNGMWRLPTVPSEYVDDEINAAIAACAKANADRIKQHLMKHRKRSHRPKDIYQCPDCPEAQMTRRPAKRKHDEYTGTDRGLVASLDYIVNLPPDIDGNTVALGFKR